MDKTKILELISKKDEQITTLQYEKELLENDYVKELKNVKEYEHICFMDLKSVYNTKPEQIIKKDNYKSKNNSSFNTFMCKMRVILDDIWQDVSKDFDFVPTYLYDTTSYMFGFEYEDIKFYIQIPNFMEIHNFNDAINLGKYKLISHPKSAICYFHIAQYENIKDMKENIKKDIQKYFEDISNISEQDLKKIKEN